MFGSRKKLSICAQIRARGADFGGRRYRNEIGESFVVEDMLLPEVLAERQEKFELDFIAIGNAKIFSFLKKLRDRNVSSTGMCV